MKTGCPALLLAWIGLIPAGLLLKYAVPAGWCRMYGAAVLYEMFWIVLAAWLWPRFRISRIALLVGLVTALLELAQLWHPAWLEAIRSTWPGQVLLGSTFDPYDFAAYVLGCAAGAGLAGVLRPAKGAGGAGVL